MPQVHIDTMPQTFLLELNYIVVVRTERVPGISTSADLDGFLENLITFTYIQSYTAMFHISLRYIVVIDEINMYTCMVKINNMDRNNLTIIYHYTYIAGTSCQF